MRRITASMANMPEQAWVVESLAGREPGRPTAGAPAARRARRARIAPGLATACAAALLAFAFIAGSLIHPLSDSSHVSGPVTSAQVVLRPLPASGAAHSQAIAYMTGDQHMSVTLRGLPRLGRGSYYELWLMSSNTDLVSVASFRTGAHGGGTLHLLLPDDPARYRFLDISVQRVGGSSGISQRSVLRGALPA